MSSRGNSLPHGVLDTAERVEIPTTGGFLDRALKDAVENSADLLDLASRLHFAENYSGMRCLELQDMISTATYANLGCCISPNFTWFTIGLGKGLASRMLRESGDGEQYLEFTKKVMESYQENICNLPYR